MSTDAANLKTPSISVVTTTSNSGYLIISSILTGFFGGLGIINWIMAMNALGGVMETIDRYSSQSRFTEMATGFYFYLGIQVVRLSVHLLMAFVAFVGVIAAQLFRLHR